MACFPDRNAAKLKTWLEAGSSADFKLTPEVVEVLGYLAYETIKEVGLHKIWQRIIISRPSYPQFQMQTH